MEWIHVIFFNRHKTGFAQLSSEGQLHLDLVSKGNLHNNQFESVFITFAI